MAGAALLEVRRVLFEKMIAMLKARPGGQFVLLMIQV
jgi:hypothetical protein